MRVIRAEMVQLAKIKSTRTIVRVHKTTLEVIAKYVSLATANFQIMTSQLYYALELPTCNFHEEPLKSMK